jgi:hypothetical protein
VLAKSAALAGTLALALILLIAAAAAGVAALATGGLESPQGGFAPQPGSSGGGGRVVCRVGGGIHGGGLNLDTEQASNAAVINQVAADQGLQPPDRAAVIALAAAIQESSLANLNHGDRDSVGLFQQRPSQGWGTPAQLTNPAYAAQQFYTHLQRVPHWWTIPTWQAAQAVQNSAFPTAYQQWQQKAENLQRFLATNPAACKTTENRN